MKSLRITRDQILVCFHNADELHVRPAGEAWNETHRVIMNQPNHCDAHRRLLRLRKQMRGNKNDSK